MTCPEDRGLDEPENAQQYESRDLAEVDVAAFARSYAAFTQAMYRAADGFGQDLNQLGRAVRDFLGVDLSTVDTVREEYAPHEVVDLDRALSELAEEYGAVRHGVRGPGRAHFESLEEFFENHTPFSLGAPELSPHCGGPGRHRAGGRPRLNHGHDRHDACRVVPARPEPALRPRRLHP